MSWPALNERELAAVRRDLAKYGITVRRLVATIAEVERERDEARFSPLGDNHHNAAACPYCTPKTEAANA
jgi:hypothetical protein